MTAPLSVVVVDHTAAMGGAELALLRLLDSLTPRIKVSALLFEPGPLVRALERRGVPVEIMSLPAGLNELGRHAAGKSRLRLATNAARLLPFIIRLSARLRALRGDVIYTTSLKADLVAGVAARISRIPLVWHIHDRIAPDYLPAPLVSLVRRVAAVLPRSVLVNSQATAETLPGLPTVIAYPGFTPDQVGERPSQRPTIQMPRIGIVGRISPTKGQLEFVQAAAKVRQVFPDAGFLIVGSAMFGQEDYRDRVHQEVELRGLGEVVEFTGFLPDTAGVLDGLSLCVHASPTPEPFGQVIVEAMIRGVPVIATRGGGADEIVEPAGEDRLGWMVPPGDVDALAATIIEALSNPGEATSRAEAAWDSATRRFPIEETARVISEQWRSVARGR